MSYQVSEIVSQKKTLEGSGNVDWHRADVVAALKKRGITISALSRANGLAGSTLANAFRSPWPKGEKIISGALGLEPQDIWPSRYQNLKQAS
ncbi:helix-turn-helix transcriptional regulator [Aeromonas caviae]|uniref:helix-turn-helix domain-containing protein n=1 Tax=Aeromonas caviae TaxID=648 RepID=UPI002B24EE4A|nr:helix-turn-helix transcriptional regulator [Aeromonas caviae]MEA9421618.1 helix-turn-helix transcriptional regulator [Aeromonas caviae]